MTPVVVVHQGSQASHAVDSSDFPTGSGLFQATANQVLAGAFYLTTPDRSAQRQTFGVADVVRVRAQIGQQFVEWLLLSWPTTDAPVVVMYLTIAGQPPLSTTARLDSSHSAA